MNWLYVCALGTAIIAGNYYQGALRHRGDQPSHPFGQRLFRFSGAVGGGLLLVLLVGGFFIGPWWQPFVAFVIGGIASAVVERILPRGMIPGWINLFMLAPLALSVLLLVR